MTTATVADVFAEAPEYGSPSTATIAATFSEAVEYAAPSTATIANLFVEVVYIPLAAKDNGATMMLYGIW